MGNSFKSMFFRRMVQGLSNLIKNVLIYGFKIIRWLLVLIFNVTYGLLTQKRRLTTIQQIDNFAKLPNRKMQGDSFEGAVKNFFSAQGIQTETVQELKRRGVIKVQGQDQGCDLIGRSEGVVIAIQCKHTSPTSKIGNYAVQEVLGSLNIYNAQKGVVVTNGYFTASAHELAKANGIYLVDRSHLLKFIA